MPDARDAPPDPAMHADLTRLARRLGLTEPPRHDPLWAAAPDFLALIVEHALARRPRRIVECGSGASTALLAACCARNGGGQVHSLEHGAQFARATRAELARLGVAEHATVLDAPLVEQRLDGAAYAWYSLARLPPGDIDMLVVDGPPAHRQADARYPALPCLSERLAADCVIFLDDAARPGERAVVARWLRDLPGLRAEFIATERGCCLLRFA
jgi:predicted O-methyltransferase YrrM